MSSLLSPEIMRKVKVERLPANTVGRDFVVGDLHGNYHPLMKLLQASGFNERIDRVFCTGDLIDRGPDSARCIGLLDKPWFHATAGNHDINMVANAARVGAFPTSAKETYIKVALEAGGAWYLEQTQPEVDAHAQKLGKLPHVMVVGEEMGDERFHVVHAALQDGGDYLDNAGVDELASRGESYWLVRALTEHRDLWKGEHHDVNPELALTYCGHTPEREMDYQQSHVRLDMGAGHPDRMNRTQKLAMICHQDKTLWTVATNDPAAVPVQDKGAAYYLRIPGSTPAQEPRPLREVPHLGDPKRIEALAATASPQTLVR
jgi:serine/threonine protein phosphatase 1